MKRKRTIDLTVEQAAERMIKQFGKRASLVASNRFDGALTQSTADFYSWVGSEIYRLESLTPCRDGVSGAVAIRRHGPRVSPGEMVEVEVA